ncbi:MAG: hypothetical protein H8E44_21055 [Planctomycetes bacterium]|nr:hypothetical protein [Planctomycetota bacterium]
MTTHRCFCVVAFLTAILPHNTNAQAPTASSSGNVQCVVDPTWPQKPDSFTWGAMSGITVDAHDQIYLFNRSEPTVQIYRTDGALVRSWSAADPIGTHHIKLDPDGNVWTADFRSHVIQKYTPEGKLLLTLGEAGVAGCDESHFDGPTDMAFLPSGVGSFPMATATRAWPTSTSGAASAKRGGEGGPGRGHFASPTR